MTRSQHQVMSSSDSSSAVESDEEPVQVALKTKKLRLQKEANSTPAPESSRRVRKATEKQQYAGMYLIVTSVFIEGY